MRPLIVGAGPVGLSAALFLARQGVLTRIIDAAESPALNSKALAVNPRTLSLLEPTGITADMLRLGKPILGARLWLNGKTLGRANLDTIHDQYPFMLGLSQATTEQLLTSALKKFGVEVERGAAIVSCRQRFAAVEAKIKHKDRAGTENIDAPWIFAADGAHSKIREFLKAGFPGHSFPETWNLADVVLETPRQSDEAHVEFLEGGGFLFMMPVYGDLHPVQTQGQIWRVLGNVPNIMSRLRPEERALGEPVWTSQYRISHRYVDRMSVGCVHFAGDAAHIHSPVGARGMNLGIEDAWVFAQAVEEGRLDTYASLREEVDREVVRNIRRFTTVVRGANPLTRFVREKVVPRAMRIPFISDRIKLMVTGLDHELPRVETQHQESYAIPSPS